MNIHKPSLDFVELVINHPDVRPTVQSGNHRIYPAADDTIYLAFDYGVAMFRRFWDEYDGHIFVLPAGRGAPALAFGRAALARLSTMSPPEQRLRTGVPLVLPASRIYCRRLGLKPEGRDLFNEYFSTEISRWAV